MNLVERARSWWKRTVGLGNYTFHGLLVAVAAALGWWGGRPIVDAVLWLVETIGRGTASVFVTGFAFAASYAFRELDQASRGDEFDRDKALDTLYPIAGWLSVTFIVGLGELLHRLLF